MIREEFELLIDKGIDPITLLLQQDKKNKKLKEKLKNKEKRIEIINGTLDLRNRTIKRLEEEIELNKL